MQIEPSQTPRLDAWSRYFARMLDVLVFSLLVGIVAAVAGTLAAPEATDEVIAVMDSSRLWTMVADLASFVIALPLIAMSLVLGQTPGKWLFGIRVRDWPHSTFHRYVQRGDLPPDWGDPPIDTTRLP